MRAKLFATPILKCSRCSLASAACRLSGACRTGELVFGTQRAALARVCFQKYHGGTGKRNKLQQGKLDTKKNSHSERGQRVEQDPEGYSSSALEVLKH